LKRYSISNENNIKNIIVIVNSSIKNAIFIIWNEHQSIDNAAHLNTDCFQTLITDRFWRIESQFVNIRSINNGSYFIFGSKNHLFIKFESRDLKYLIFKCRDAIKGNFSYFVILNKQFNELLNQLLFCNFKKEDELAHFNPRIMSTKNLMIEMMDACKEFWQLFFKRRLIYS
jgi:hypothetical protein